MNKQDKSLSIIMWILGVAVVLLSLLYVPSLGGGLMLLGGVMMLPIEKLNAFWESKKIRAWLRIVVGIVLFLVGITIAPGSNGSSQPEAAKPAKSYVGEWHYGDSKALDEYFKFNEDGTFEKSTDGGSDDQGTYEVVNGNTLMLHGEWSNSDYEFTIVDSETITDFEGEKLVRNNHK